MELSNFDVADGLAGLERDLIHSIISNMSSLSSVCNIIGICQELYLFSHHSRFKWALTNVSGLNTSVTNHFCYADVVELEQTDKKYKFKDKNSTSQLFIVKNCSDPNGFGNFVVDRIIFEGKWRFEGRWHNIVTYSDVAIGFAYFESKLPHDYYCGNTDFIDYYFNGDCLQNGLSLGNNPYGAGDKIAVEVDMNKEKMIVLFTVNGVVQPVMYSDIPKSLRMDACSSEPGNIFEFISLRRIAGLSHMLSSCYCSSSKSSTSPSSGSSSLTPHMISPVYDPNGLGLQARIIPWNYNAASADR